jgi:hypothetical protein
MTLGGRNNSGCMMSDTDDVLFNGDFRGTGDNISGVGLI